MGDGRVHQTPKPGKGSLLRPRDPIPFSHVVEGLVIESTIGERMFINDGVVRDMTIRIRSIEPPKTAAPREVPKELKDVPESLRAMISTPGESAPAKVVITFEIDGVNETRTRELEVRAGYQKPDGFELPIQAGDLLRIKVDRYAGISGIAIGYSYLKGQK